MVRRKNTLIPRNRERPLPARMARMLPKFNMTNFHFLIQKSLVHMRGNFQEEVAGFFEMVDGYFTAGAGRGVGRYSRHFTVFRFCYLVYWAALVYCDGIVEMDVAKITRGIAIA